MTTTLVLPGYEITQELCRTPTQVLARGIKLLSNTSVLLRIIPSRDTSQVDFAKLKREISLISQYNLHIAPKPLEILRQESEIVMVMADFGTTTLEGYKANYPLSIESFLLLAIELCEALEALHSEGITHTALHPGNILYAPLSENDRIKITGLDSATLLNEEYVNAISLTEYDPTIVYMAPEQSGRINHSIGFRSNLYSLGVIFYEMLVAKALFGSDDPVEIIHSHISQTAPSIREQNPTISPVIEKIVLKLLEKSARKRYQSCSGLISDFKRCLSDIDTHGEITEFSIATSDVTHTLHFPQILYGRDDETATLLNGFETARQGKFMMALIGGYSGIGKSALVAEVHKPILKHRGYFISGKYDQLQKNKPYSALLIALRQLSLQVLSESDEKLERCRTALIENLQGNGELIVSAIPEAKPLINHGAKPLASLPVAESQNRYRDTLAAFLLSFAKQEHPLTLFIDDLQWADNATIDFLSYLAQEADNPYLFIIGAYRDNEVDGSHPLSLSINQLLDTGVPLTQISLQPLQAQNVHHFISDSLNVPLHDCVELNELVVKKTGANPFFIKNFIQHLVDNDWIKPHPRKPTWQWDLDNISAAQITDNVVDLLSQRILRIDGKSQNLLKTAACIGNQFTLSLLARASEQSKPQTAATLWESLSAGFVRPMDDNYKAAESYDSLLEDLEVRYRFSHDRFQQAAYSLLEDKEKKLRHYNLARILHKEQLTGSNQVSIFDLADHYNKALPLVEGKEERELVKGINITAATKAKSSVAFTVAAQLFENAAELIGPSGFTENYRQTMDVHLNLAECYYILGQHKKADKQYDIISAEIQESSDQDKLFDIQLRQFSQQGQNRQTLDKAVQVLSGYGVKFSVEPSLLKVGRDIVKTKLMLRKRNISALVDAPVMEDSDAINAINTLLNISATTYVFDANTHVLLVSKMTQLSLKYGNASSSAFAYGLFGFIEGAAFGNFKNSQAFSELSMQLAENIDDPIIVGKVKFLKAFANQHWYEPIADCLGLVNDAYKILYNNGSYVFAAYSLFTITMKELYISNPLDKVYNDAVEYSKFANQVGEEYSTNLLMVLRRFMSKLSGHYHGDYEQQDRQWDEAVFTEELEERKFIMALAWHYVYNQATAYLFGDTEKSFAYLQKAKMIDMGAPTTMAQIEHHFYNVLILSDCYAQTPRHKRSGMRLKLARSLRQLKIWANAQPDNFNARYLLANAKWLSVSSTNKAGSAFNLAIAAAKQANSLSTSALASELWGEHLLNTGEVEKAITQLEIAVQTWRRWGADKKADQLEALHPELISTELTESPAATSQNLSEFLDVETIIRATQTISAEIKFDKLLQNLLTILMQNVGAQKGFLVLNHHNFLAIEAQSIKPNGDIDVLLNEAITGTDKLSPAIVNLVFRTGETVVMNDAQNDENFANEPYIIENNIRSVLCVPITNQAKTTGVAYFENNLSTGVFTHERVNLTSMLATQAAISIENARLYDSLEQRVTERTRELADEKKRSDDLLLNILPEQTAIELRTAGKAEAKHFDNVTVLFTDFVGFTRASERLSPNDLVKEVDIYFKSFDRIMKKHNVEKLKTIGDSYMAAGGLPIVNTTHARDAVAAALEIVEFTQRRMDSQTKKNLPAFALRIGIHSGPVTTGVVGEHKFQYDIWGDTVNTASRLESSGEAGKINISGSTYAQVNAFYDCEHRGKIEAKGKGKIDMYFVE